MLRAQQLPLPTDKCLIARSLQAMPKSGLVSVEYREAGIVPDIRNAGHDLDATWRTQRLRIAMLETHPVLCESINVWRLVLLAAIAAIALVSDVIGHDQNDVWLLRMTRDQGTKPEEASDDGGDRTLRHDGPKKGKLGRVWASRAL